MARYWVVSANVNGPKHRNKLGTWIETIFRNESAYMGWPSGSSEGRRLGNVFAKISKDDVILVAYGTMRDHGSQRKLVACGRVTSNRPTADARVSELTHAQFVRLAPFEKLDQDARRSGVSFKGTPYENSPQPPAIYELSRMDGRYPGNPSLCDWLDRMLGERRLRSSYQRKPQSVLVAVHSVQTHCEPNSDGYDRRTNAQQVRAMCLEDALVRKFRYALKKQGRETVIHVYSVAATVLRCDVYEESKRHLIEAKASCSREDVRMAIGQLFDYCFLAQSAGLAKPKLALLLPTKPPDDVEQMLDSIGIASIWKAGNQFKDNRRGRFVGRLSSVPQPLRATTRG